jgi:hypothetical protein
MTLDQLTRGLPRIFDELGDALVPHPTGWPLL